MSTLAATDVSVSRRSTGVRIALWLLLLLVLLALVTLGYAFFESHATGMPIEFRILKYRPKPWQADDSIVIANQMVKDLNYYTFGDMLAREKVLAKLGPELTADVYVNRSWHDRPPTVMREDLNDQVNQGNTDDDDDEDEGPDNSVARQRSTGTEIWAQR